MLRGLYAVPEIKKTGCLQVKHLTLYYISGPRIILICTWKIAYATLIVDFLQLDLVGIANAMVIGKCSTLEDVLPRKLFVLISQHTAFINNAAYYYMCHKMHSSG